MFTCNYSISYCKDTDICEQNNSATNKLTCLATKARPEQNFRKSNINLLYLLSENVPQYCNIEWNFLQKLLVKFVLLEYSGHLSDLSMMTRNDVKLSCNLHEGNTPNEGILMLKI